MTPKEIHDASVRDQKQFIENLTDEEKVKYLTGALDGIVMCANLVPAVNNHPEITKVHEFVLAEQDKAQQAVRAKKLLQKPQ